MLVARQVDQTDCGPAALATVLALFGRREPLYRLPDWAGTTQSGTSLLGMYRAAQQAGLEARALEADLEALFHLDLPAILHWEHNHYVVLLRLARNRALIADPARAGFPKAHEPRRHP
ncbi:MAG: cysteine peptidase family C39 domain-containing protein [Meiothermus sp.]|nr:cysteine peptidase family C39 domain-containing protein [Meiothermus sp.]